MSAPDLPVPIEQCTLELCPVQYAQIPYAPNLPGNVFYLSIFAISLLANLVLGVRHRTWGYMVGMVCGCFLEVLGYVGRIQMHYNPFLEDPFLMYLICASIGPVFLTAAIYLCLGRIIIVYCESLSYFRPRTYTILFVTCDIISLALQAGGGAIVSSSDDADMSLIGLRLMQIGLAFQVASLVVFVVLCSMFAYACRQHPGQRDLRFTDLRARPYFRFFLWALSLATIFMITRCAFRVAELIEGFQGKIWGSEVDYMILEGAMISLCVILMTVGHPGVCFGKQYDEANFRFRRVKGKTGSDLELMDSDRLSAPN